MLLVSLVNTLVLSYNFLVATTIIKSEEMSIDAYDFIGSAICFLLLEVACLWWRVDKSIFPLLIFPWVSLSGFMFFTWQLFSNRKFCCVLGIYGLFLLVFFIFGHKLSNLIITSYNTFLHGCFFTLFFLTSFDREVIQNNIKCIKKDP